MTEPDHSRRIASMFHVFAHVNNWDFNALGTIYRQETGHDIYSSFLERIAQPLGRQDFRVEDGDDLLESATEYSGYGYVWRTYPQFGSHDAATGAGSQMLVVSPQQSLVVVHLKATNPMMSGIERSKFWRLYGMIAAADESRKNQ